MADNSWDFYQTCWLQEDHKSPLYGASFNFFSREHHHVFATTGSNRASVYRCRPDGGLDVLQVYIDPTKYPNGDNTSREETSSEDFYVCAWSVDVDSGAPLLLLGGTQRQLHVVDCANGVLRTSFEGHGEGINDIAVHPTCPHIVATASRDQSLRVWNLRSRACVLIFQGDGGHRNEVLSCDWKPGGGYILVSAGMDNTVKIWDLQVFQETLTSSDDWDAAAARGKAFPTRHVTMPVFSTQVVHWNYVDCVRWVGNTLLSKSVDDRIVCWQPDPAAMKHDSVRTTPEERLGGGAVRYVQELQLDRFENVWWMRFALDYSRRVLAQGTGRGRVLVFCPHRPSKKPMAVLKPSRTGSDDPSRNLLVRQTAVSFDGKIVIAVHEDGSVTRWDRKEPTPGGACDGAAAG